jgi:hypothetical protein
MRERRFENVGSDGAESELDLGVTAIGRSRSSLRPGTRAEGGLRFQLSNLLQPLHVMDAGNLSHSLNDVFQVLQVGDIEDDIHVRLSV